MAYFQLQIDLNRKIKIMWQTWSWVMRVMDWTEAQLRYGSALNKAGEPINDGRNEIKD